MEKIIVIALTVFTFASCENRKEVSSQIENDFKKLEPYTPQIWVDNFLSDDKKDTLKVLLWSNKMNGYLDSIPIDTSADWPTWYRENKVVAVLMLNNVRPLWVYNCKSLLHCSVLKENGKRAIAIVPNATQMSNVNVCEIYSIKNNSWIALRKFGILSSFTYSENGEEPELSREWLVERNGRWMYRDYDYYLTEEDTSFHYVFAKPVRKEVSDWKFKYEDREYPAKVPGFIQYDLKRNGLLGIGQSENWYERESWEYLTSVDLTSIPEYEGDLYLVFEGIAGNGVNVYVSLFNEDEPDGGIHYFFNYVHICDTFAVRDKWNRHTTVGIQVFFSPDSLTKVYADYDIPQQYIEEFSFIAPNRSGWRWREKLNTCGIWKPVYIINGAAL